MSSTPPRDTSPARGGVNGPQVGSPVRPWTPGEPMSYGPGLDQAPPVLPGEVPNSTGGLGFTMGNVSGVGQFPIGDSHGSGAGFGWESWLGW